MRMVPESKEAEIERRATELAAEPEYDLAKLSERAWCPNKYSRTMAHHMADFGHVFPLDRMDILSMEDSNGDTVAHRMAAKGYSFPLDRMDILSLEGKKGYDYYASYSDGPFGATVAAYMARQGYLFPEHRLDILALRGGEDGLETVAHEMVFWGHRFTLNQVDILKLKGRNGSPVIHAMCSKDCTFDIIKDVNDVSDEILSISDSRGLAVAHLLAWGGEKFHYASIDVLSLTHDGGEETGSRTVAHYLASYGVRFPKYREDILELRPWCGETVQETMDEYAAQQPVEYNMEALLVKSEDGNTLAHEMALEGHVFPLDRSDILTLRNTDSGCSVAHCMALKGYSFPAERVDILMISDREGNTVAHYMVDSGVIFGDRETRILSLSNNDGVSVAHAMSLRGHLFSPNVRDILSLADGNDVTVEDLQNRIYHSRLLDNAD